MFTLKGHGLPEHLTSHPLCYVRFYRMSVGQSSVGLYQVERVDPTMGHATGVVLLTDVAQAVDLVPVFNSAFPHITSSSKTCMEGYASYYLNTFTDKETFHALHHCP